MNAIKPIRDRLGLTQAAFAEGIGMTQGNVGHYERGQTVPPVVASRVIDFAAGHGLLIGFDHVYGRLELPAQAPTADTAPQAAATGA